MTPEEASDPLLVPVATDPAAPSGQEGSPRPRLTRGAIVAVVCSLACLAVMAGVIALANEADESGGGKNGRAAGVPPQSPTEVFGRPYTDPAAHASEVGGCGPIDPDHPPEIEIDVPNGVLELGKLKQGVQMTVDATFKSAGTGPLCIGQVTTGCGCVKVTLVGDKKRFEPGEPGTIRLLVDTSGQIGSVSKTVSILCNDAKSPRRSFNVHMDVSAGLLAEPRFLQFGNVPRHTPVTRTLTLKSGLADQPWKILGLESTRSIAGRKPIQYAYEVEPLQDPTFRMLKVRVTHPGYDELGAISDLIVLTTDHPDRPRIEIRAHVNVVPRIRSKSRVVSLGFVQSGVPRAPTRTRLEAAPGVTFQVVKVEVVPREGTTAGPGGPGFEASFGKDDSGWWVDVKFDGKTRGEGLLEAELLIHTDNAQEPVVRVPLRATVNDRR